MSRLSAYYVALLLFFQYLLGKKGKSFLKCIAIQRPMKNQSIWHFSASAPLHVCSFCSSLPLSGVVCRGLSHSCRQQFATKCGTFKATHSHTKRLQHRGVVQWEVERAPMANIDVDYRSHLTKKRLIYKHINNMRAAPTGAKSNSRGERKNSNGRHWKMCKISEKNRKSSGPNSSRPCHGAWFLQLLFGPCFIGSRSGRCGSVLAFYANVLASCSVGADFRPCVTVANEQWPGLRSCPAARQ